MKMNMINMYNCDLCLRVCISYPVIQHLHSFYIVHLVIRFSNYKALINFVNCQTCTDGSASHSNTNCSPSSNQIPSTSSSDNLGLKGGSASKGDNSSPPDHHQ